MPPRRLPPGHIQAGTKLCNCWKYCKGKLSSVDARTYNRHEQYRTTPAEVLESYYRENPHALGQNVPEGISTRTTGRSALPPSGSGSGRVSASVSGSSAGRSSGVTGHTSTASASTRPASSSHAAAQTSSASGTPRAATRQGPATASPAQQETDIDIGRISPPPTGGLGGTATAGAAQAQAGQRAPPREPDPAPPLPPPRGQPAGPDDPVNDTEEGYGENLGVPRDGYREDVRVTNAFIRGLEHAELARSGLDSETLARMHAPRQALPAISSYDRAGMRLFLARGDASQDNYMDVRRAITELHPEDEARFPTYAQIKATVASFTGITAVKVNMCINSCIAYTGPYSTLRLCPDCGEPRYDLGESSHGKDLPRRTFNTFPLGPQLQTLYADPESARRMRHRETRTSEIQREIAVHAAQAVNPDNRANTSSHHRAECIPIIDDIYLADDYLDLVDSQKIKPDDIVLMFSIDGAQLYQNKASDCWFGVWIILNLSPEYRYKKDTVLPAFIVGGPRKPGNLDSFLYPGLYHLAGLQREGLNIWDAARNVVFRSDPFLYLSLADSPAMAYMNGLVGHNGKSGCRVYCGQQGFNKPGKPTYYPALQRPRLALAAAPEARDWSIRDLPSDTAADIQRYQSNLLTVVRASSQAEYARRRLDTGIAKPTIFSGLSRAQRAPRGFGLDLMHLISLNLTDLIIALLRGTLACEAPDDKSTWSWAVFADLPTWRAHGDIVGAATRYLPSSFDRPPRNPALKISSGYKAHEFLLYVYGLLPGLLRPYQAPVFYQHFCTLVLAVRILLQRSLPRQQLPIASACIVQYVEQYEVLYYQGRVERLHFVRPSLHTLAHIPTEIERTGTASLYTQWTLENFIGNLTREIKQHVTPYANVSERALRRCQVNALRSMIPDLTTPEPSPRRLIDLGNEYVLLSPFDNVPRPVGELEVAAMHAFYRRMQVTVDPTNHPIVQRWARLRLPTGQNARTAWKEVPLERRQKEPRRSRMAKLQDGRVVEIQYFFQNVLPTKTVTAAMVSVFSSPDTDIYSDSMQTVLACTYRGGEATSYEVVPAKSIVAVVAMVPLPLTRSESETPDQYADRYFLVEKPGLDIAYLAGQAQEEMDAGADDY